MPPNNRLAPPVRNALASYVPAPLDSNMLPPKVQPSYGLRSRLENLSIGLGRGVTEQLQGAKQLATDPVGSVRAFVDAARAAGADPMSIIRALRELRQKAASGPIGFGEVMGGMLPLGPRTPALPAKMAGSVDNLNDFPQEWIAKQTPKDVPEKIRGGVSFGMGHEDFEALVGNPARKAVAEGKSISVKLKDGTPVSLVRFVDEDFGEERLLALSPNGDVIGDMGYALSKGFHPTIFVSENAQRKGLATAMYDVAEKAGASIPAYSDSSAFRTPAGEAFRKARESTRRTK